MVLNTSSSFNEVCQKEDKFLIVVKFLLIEVRGRLSIRNSQLLCPDTEFFITCVSPNTLYILHYGPFREYWGFKQYGVLAGL